MSEHDDRYERSASETTTFLPTSPASPLMAVLPSAAANKCDHMPGGGVDRACFSPHGLFVQFRSAFAGRSFALPQWLPGLSTLTLNRPSLCPRPTPSRLRSMAFLRACSKATPAPLATSGGQRWQCRSTFLSQDIGGSQVASRALMAVTASDLMVPHSSACSAPSLAWPD